LEVWSLALGGRVCVRARTLFYFVMVFVV